jgi:hypothetical protein
MMQRKQQLWGHTRNVPIIIANLKTLVCGTKDANCCKRSAELVQTQTVDENCHTNICLLIQVIYLLQFKKKLLDVPLYSTNSVTI